MHTGSHFIVTAVPGDLRATLGSSPKVAGFVEDPVKLCLCSVLSVTSVVKYSFQEFLVP